MPDNEICVKISFATKVDKKIKIHFVNTARAIGKGINEAVEEALREYIVNHADEANKIVKAAKEFAEGKKGRRS